MKHRSSNSKPLFQVIKDPVHGSMQFSAQEAHWIMPFIDHANLQRLRHIKQAGLCDWFFPGAVHTRFNHSVGCSYVAGQIANKIGLSAEEKQTVMIACLLHDIGHGPFSHVFESVFYRKSIKHEMWTPYFLKEFSQPEFLEKVNFRSKECPLTKSRLQTVADIIMHKEKKKLLLADIVSSQLDADRLDYLLRDSHFCGVKYGQYDFRWLLHCLTIIESRNQRRLGITASGVGAVEHYLMARRLMTRNVYQHGKKHASEFYLTEFLKLLSHGLLEDARFAPVKHKTLSEFIMRVNQFNAEIKDAVQPERVIKHFLKTNYAFYKTLYDYDVFSVIRECAQMDFKHPAISLAKRLQSRNLPKAIRINADHDLAAKELVQNLQAKCKNKLEPWQLKVLHLPHQSYQAERDPILVRDEAGRVRRLHDHSFVMRALSDQWESSSIVCVDQEALALPAVSALCKKLKRFA